MIDIKPDNMMVNSKGILYLIDLDDTVFRHYLHGEH